MDFIRLEDGYSDIISKAQQGKGLSDLALMEASGLSMLDIAAAKSGVYEPAATIALAEVLELNGEALMAIGSGNWNPKPVSIEGWVALVQACPVPGYAEMTTNQYLARLDSGDWILFDTGVSAQPILDHISDSGGELRAIYLTHGHTDHVCGLGELRDAYPDVRVFAHPAEGISGAEHITEGSVEHWQGIELHVLETPGHSPGGLTFVLRGLSRNIAVVGDAVFAGSIGKIHQDYGNSLQTIRDKIMSLPQDTVLAPGHGPQTTVGEENQNNPFLA